MERLKWSVISSVVVMASLLGSANAQAQMGMSAVSGWSPWSLGGGGSYGGGTADGNYLSGWSQVIRSQGDYNLSTSQGLINYEEARAKYIDNTNKWTQAYFQMREANQAYQLQNWQRNRHTPEALAQAAASELPRKLSSRELDPVTGRIAWPEVLMDEQFSDLRNDIEDLFDARARTKRALTTSVKIRDDARLMMDRLRENIEYMPANDFIAARKFILALDYAVITSGKTAAVTPPTPEPPAPRLSKAPIGKNGNRS
jgi:hypothetical protein